jgi:hypothetical protein
MVILGCNVERGGTFIHWMVEISPRFDEKFG